MGWEFRLNEVFGCGWIGEDGGQVKQFVSRQGGAISINARRKPVWYFITNHEPATLDRRVMAGLVPAIHAAGLCESLIEVPPVGVHAEYEPHFPGSFLMLHVALALDRIADVFEALVINE